MPASLATRGPLRRRLFLVVASLVADRVSRHPPIGVMCTGFAGVPPRAARLPPATFTDWAWTVGTAAWARVQALHVRIGFSG